MSSERSKKIAQPSKTMGEMAQTRVSAPHSNNRALDGDLVVFGCSLPSTSSV